MTCSPAIGAILSIDKLTDKRYFETQNYFESRVSPGAEARAFMGRLVIPSASAPD
jgi:hypothetical protein